MSLNRGSDLHRRFRDLVASYSGAVKRLCSVYALNPADRDDLFQDIFLAIWRALPSFRGDASDRTWLYRIGHNVALTWQAKDRRVRNREHRLDETPLTSCEPIDVRRIMLFEIVSQLPPVDRQLISLWLEGLTAREMEAITGIRAATVAVRLTRIRNRVATALKQPEVAE